ncbi:hypothetical protein LCGC14_0985060 [marine sediment metagenome]|uniref:Uncharacterized protein n=1 Tax=marine sediment metagenome TaxID=412755 RepID=A0A0F9NC04_9ZZZZ|nr:hypothetical protein [bacterium]
MGFLDLIPPDTFLENLGISAFIFNQSEVTLSEIYGNLKIERIRLKNKMKEMVKLKLITVEKIAAKNDIKITSTETLGLFFEAFLEQINSEKSYERDITHKTVRKKRRRGKYDNVIIRATPQLAEFLDTTRFLVRSTENQLKKKGYI